MTPLWLEEQELKQEHERLKKAKAEFYSLTESERRERIKFNHVDPFILNDDDLSTYNYYHTEQCR